MKQCYEESASRILGECSRVLQKPQLIKVSKDQNQIKSEISYDQNNISLNKQTLAINIGISPHEQSQNNKIIEKLRRKANKKKQSKQIFIRKTDLGQNQLIFTKEQLQRLKALDDQELYGYVQESGLNSNKLSPSQIQKQGVQNKYFSLVTLDNPKQQIQKYLSWIDLNQLKDNRNKKKSKILNFQKHQKSSININLNSYSQNKCPLPILLNKKSTPYSPYGIQKSLQLNKSKSCSPLIKKNSVDAGFLNSLNSNDQYVSKNMSQKQKLNQLIARVNQKIQKQCYSNKNGKHIYMTDERKQAIFQCQVIRKIKSEMGPKFYNKLQLTYGQKNNKNKTNQNQTSDDKQNIQGVRLNQKIRKGRSSIPRGYLNLQGGQLNIQERQGNKFFKGQSSKQHSVFKQNRSQQSQSQRMISKNRNRLKQQKKRVIQKLVC